MRYETKVDSVRTMESLATSFLKQKRALGYKYDTMESSLRQLTRYATAQGLATCSLSQELVLAFCERHPRETPKSQANRCSNVRQFTMFLNANRFKAFVPDGHHNRRSEFTPYIFTHEEIARIFKAVDAIKPHARYNCSVVYPVLFRMLYGWLVPSAWKPVSNTAQQNMCGFRICFSTLKWRGMIVHIGES